MSTINPNGNPKPPARRFLPDGITVSEPTKQLVEGRGLVTIRQVRVEAGPFTWETRVSEEELLNLAFAQGMALQSSQRDFEANLRKGRR